MKDILLYNGKFYYTRSQAIIWVCNGSCSSHSLSQRHFDLIDLITKEKKEPVVINCHVNTSIEENAYNRFLSNYDNDRAPIIFNNLSSENANVLKRIIEDSIELNIKLECDLFCRPGQNYHLILRGKSRSASAQNFENLSDECELLEYDKVKGYLSSCYKPYPNRTLLHSTAITATGEFDAFKIISDPALFLWVSLRLSDLVNKLLSSSIIQDYRILAVSLRGTILAGAVAGLCGLSVNTIDHLGPKYKVIDLEFTETLRNKKYIYIGDFVIGGTEIKIAQAYTKMFNGELNYAFSIGSMLPAINYGSSFKLESLYQLSDLADIKYSIDIV